MVSNAPVNWCTKIVMNVVRAIPDLFWAKILVTAVGIGAFAGAWALSIFSLAVMVKLFSETIDGADERPLEAARAGVAQTLTAMEDEPRQKMLVELRRRCYDAPWGLPTDGDLNDLKGITHADVRAHYDEFFGPNQAILGIAGNVDADRIIVAGKAQVEQERNQVREELRKDVATLALRGAEQILMREVDAGAHSDTLQKLSAQL